MVGFQDWKKTDIVKKNAGFTLIEVLVALAITGVVASMISVLMVSGSRFFHKQSGELDLQNDYQIISNMVSTAVIEAPKAMIVEERQYNGRSVMVFYTGKKYFVQDIEAGILYVFDNDENDYEYMDYDENRVFTFDRGNILSSQVVDFQVRTLQIDEEAQLNKAGSVHVEILLKLSNTQGSLEQSFQATPRNSNIGFERK